MRAITWFAIATGLASVGALTTAFVIKKVQERRATTSTTTT
jgi:hypothetical protein